MAEIIPNFSVNPAAWHRHRRLAEEAHVAAMVDPLPTVQARLEDPLVVDALTRTIVQSCSNRNDSNVWNRCKRLSGKRTRCCRYFRVKVLDNNFVIGNFDNLTAVYPDVTARKTL